jgi:tryptophan synthase beta chain
LVQYHSGPAKTPGAAAQPMELIKQEMSGESWIEIPDELRKILTTWRPTPLVRAFGLEKALKTKARIYFKDESKSPAGSHKTNTSVAQAYYNKKEGVKRIATETGAGQWGSALSYACNMFGLECQVYMVKVSYDQKPYRKIYMQTYGATVDASPSMKTNAGRKVNADLPGCQGSLGIAISEAVEDAALREDTKYSLGSVLNHVILHQTIIDVMVACVGGGSNFGGFTFPFIADKTKGGKDIKFVAVEPAACPSMTKGLYTYDFGDVAGMTPAMLMHTLGHTFVPSGIHAGGLRYHGNSPLVSLLVDQKIVEPVAYHQTECFEAGILFARTEGILPAPETTHAIKGAIVEAMKPENAGKAIVFNLSGHGHFDMFAYEAYLSGKVKDVEFPMDELKEALKHIPQVKL